MQIDLLLILTGALVGAASGYLGSFMVLKRMSLVGDALSHVALPGMAIALTLGANPILGAFAALFIAIIGVWYLGENSEISPEALVGVFFTASLSIGILITPEPELLEALFGSLDKIGFVDSLVTILAVITIYFVIQKISKNLLLGIISEDLAKSTGINTSLVNLIYLLMVGLVVALGVKFVGTLLMGALVIVPAVTAKNIAKSKKGFQYISSLVGALSVIVGILISRAFNTPSGPTIVLSSIGFFLVSFFQGVQIPRSRQVLK